MPSFGETSKKRLTTCDPRLQEVLQEVVKEFDCSVLEGHRSADRQQELFEQGKSKVQYPNSKHNSYPSAAVDVVPYPVDWDDLERMAYFAGYVKGVAAAKGIKLRWGGDWDSDGYIKDHSFLDYPHFEILE